MALLKFCRRAGRINIAIRTQGKDKAAGRRTRQGAEEGLPRLDHIFDGEQTLFKSRAQFFMAVGHAAPHRPSMIDVVRAEGNKYGLHADKLSKATLLLAIDRLCSPA